MDVNIIYVDGSKAEFKCDGYELDDPEGFLSLQEENSDEELEDVHLIQMDEIRSISFE